MRVASRADFAHTRCHYCISKYAAGWLAGLDRALHDFSWAKPTRVVSVGTTYTERQLNGELMNIVFR